MESRHWLTCLKARACLALTLGFAVGALRLEAQSRLCDELAASPDDKQAVTSGVPHDKLDGDAAVVACQAAVDHAPDVARFRFQLGRALAKLRRFEEAVQQYRRTLDLAPDHVLASVALGLCYMNGEGVKRDYREAIRYARPAAKNGDAFAQLVLALVYNDQNDDAEAVRWYRKASKNGNALAQENLGRRYMQGRGVKKDYANAMRLSRLAFDQGNTKAATSIGFMYRNGLGVRQDYAEALRWYERAAESGDLWAVNNIGSIYENGDGVKKDLEKAAAYYRRAAEGGVDLARKNLDRLVSSGQVLPPAPKPLVLERPPQTVTPAAPVVQPTVLSLQVTAEPATVRVGEVVELRLSYAVQAGPGESVPVRQIWTLSFARQALPNFPVEREVARASGSFDASFSQTIPAVAAPGRYDVRGEVCVGGDCISRGTSFDVAR
ncbi:MAG: sel1 repeat family protein [Vicinamibacteria bacterium]|nr:sel1 repeat family protein [Vicinamibacteria bacterium]